MDWTYYCPQWGSTNPICGLGKEQSSHRSESFNSFAVSYANLDSNVYSFEIDPHFQ